MYDLIECREWVSKKCFRVVCIKDEQKAKCEICGSMESGIPKKTVKGLEDRFLTFAQMENVQGFYLMARSMSTRICMFNNDEKLGYFKAGKKQGSYRVCFGLIPNFGTAENAIVLTNWYLHRSDQEREAQAAHNKCKNIIQRIKECRKKVKN